MPMFDFRCDDCGNRGEHFIYSGDPLIKICPMCGRGDYKRQFSSFRSTVEYSNPDEHMEKIINPGVSEIYSKIGREALDEDAGTLENVFGADSVKATIAETDD